jgi:hypothetical protein
MGVLREPYVTIELRYRRHRASFQENLLLQLRQTLHGCIRRARLHFKIFHHQHGNSTLRLLWLFTRSTLDPFTWQSKQPKSADSANKVSSVSCLGDFHLVLQLELHQHCNFMLYLFALCDLKALWWIRKLEPSIRFFADSDLLSDRQADLSLAKPTQAQLACL